MFREQIEQLRQDAGENWLSYYNDIAKKVIFFDVLVLKHHKVNILKRTED